MLISQARIHMDNKELNYATICGNCGKAYSYHKERPSKNFNDTEVLCQEYKTKFIILNDVFIYNEITNLLIKTKHILIKKLK